MKSRWQLVLALLILPLSLLGIAFVLVAAVVSGLPDVTKMRGCLTTTMFQVDLCPGGANYSNLSNISSSLIDAVIASEDSGFYSHRGFDWHEIRSSFFENLRERGIKRGGSTITQQLVKNVFLTPDKSMLRKLREAILTYEVERHFSKRDILERYLNVVEFGPGLYGVRAAARHYFGKAPSQLHVLESAFLAFLLPNPTGYSKSFTQGSLTPFARKMVKTIVRRLERFKKIPATEAGLALSLIDQFPWRDVSIDQLRSESPAEVALPLEEEEVDPEVIPSQEEMESTDDSVWQ